MKIMTEQGETESVWMDAGRLENVEEGTFARLEVGGYEGLVCTEIRVPRYVDEAAAHRIALKAVIAAEGRGCEPSRLLTDDGLEARVEREPGEELTPHEIDGRIHDMTYDELHRYGSLTGKTVFALLAPIIVVPMLAAWIGWDPTATGAWRYIAPAAWAFGGLIATALMIGRIKDALLGEQPVDQLAKQYIASGREKERRENAPKVVVIGQEA